jgi:hypothetical protein
LSSNSFRAARVVFEVRVATDESIITAVLDGITATVAELILRKLQQLSVVVEASSAAEEMPRPVGSPSPP